MAKEALKIEAINSGRVELPEGVKLKVVGGEAVATFSTGESKVIPFSHLDIHRPRHRAQGGTYEQDNVVMLAKDHLKEHDNWRTRTPEHEALKNAYDHRQQLLKLALKVNNQMLAFERGTDNPPDGIMEMLQTEADRYRKMERESARDVARKVKALAKVDPVVKAAIGVKGLGEVTIAALTFYVDIRKARHPSSLWAYCGYDKPSHKRFTKNEAGGGNRNLRTVLFNFSDSQIKTRGAYREVYDNVKARLEVSEKITETKVAGKTGTTEKAWKNCSKGHRDGAARRAVCKHLLADYWFVARTLNGLETNPTYAEAQLGMSHKTIDPKSRGWEY